MTVPVTVPMTVNVLTTLLTTRLTTLLAPLLLRSQESGETQSEFHFPSKVEIWGQVRGRWQSDDVNREG